MTDNVDATIDVRTIPPGQRHPLIFSTFQSLKLGRAMQLVNDHAPNPLHRQFMAEMPGQFDWQYLEEGPDTWRVQISRIARGEGCCGSCC